MVKKVISMLSVLALCVCMLAVFTACGEESSESEQQSEYDLDLNTDDLCYATMGVPGDSVLFTVDGEDVTASMYLYWLVYDLSYYEYYAYYYAYYYGEDLYDMSADADMLKEDARDLASQYTLIAQKAKERGLSLSAEQNEEIDESLDELKEEYGGEEELLNALRESGLDMETYRTLLESGYYADLLMENEFSGRPTEEELNAYIDDNDLMYMKHILILTCDDNYDPLPDDEKEEKLKFTEDLLEQIKNSDDPEATFDELMNEYSEDSGLSSYPDGYLFTSGEMVAPVEDAVRELEYGEVSGIVEYDGLDDGYYSGYHIILRLDPADYEGIDEDWVNDEFSEEVMAWSENAEYKYSEEWDNIDIVEFWEKYSEYQNAFAEESDGTT